MTDKVPLGELLPVCDGDVSDLQGVHFFDDARYARTFAEDRRKLLAFARDLLNSDYAGHRLTFVQFAQAPHFNHLNALYQSFDFRGPLDLVKNFAGLSEKVDAPAPKGGA